MTYLSLLITVLLALTVLTVGYDAADEKGRSFSYVEKIPDTNVTMSRQVVLTDGHLNMIFLLPPSYFNTTLLYSKSPSRFGVGPDFVDMYTGCRWSASHSGGVLLLHFKTRHYSGHEFGFPLTGTYTIINQIDESKIITAYFSNYVSDKTPEITFATLNRRTIMNLDNGWIDPDTREMQVTVELNYPNL